MFFTPKLSTSLFFYICFSLLCLCSCSGQKEARPATETYEGPHIFPSKQQPTLDSASQIGNYFPDLFQNSKGNLWFATAFNGLAKFDGDTLIRFTELDSLLDNTILDLAEDSEGNIWIATRAGISKYNGNRFIHFTEKDGLISNSTSSILVDRKDNVWIGPKV